MSNHHLHVAFHHAKHKVLHSLSENPGGTLLGLAAGVGVIAVAGPALAGAAVASAAIAGAVGVSAAGAAAAGSTIAGAVGIGTVAGCGILGGEAEKAIKKH